MATKFIAPIESKNQSIIYYKTATASPTTINLTGNQTPLSYITNFMKSNDTLVLQAETGSGKTTRLPIGFLNNSFFNSKKIYATQPRVFNVTKNVEILRSIASSPDLVGFKTGPLTELSPKNRIIMLTEGTLILELLSNPALLNNSILILDEVHERTMDLDLIMALVKHKSKRTKVIITSATLETTKLSTYFNNAPIIQVEGIKPNLAPTNFLSEDTDNYIDKIYSTIYDIHTKNPPIQSKWKDILVFLPTKSTIFELFLKLTQSPPSELKDILTTKLFRGTTPEEQRLSIEPLNLVAKPGITRRVILATNVAETGINFNELKYVIDSGWSNVNSYDPYTNSTALILSNITQSQAIQRWGRAGRDQTDRVASQGIVYAMYTEETFNNVFPKNQLPQIFKQPIDKFMLMLLASKSLSSNQLLDQPTPETTSRALSNLFYNGLIQKSTPLPTLTEFAESIAVKLKVDPKYSRMLLASINYRCTIPILQIVSMLTLGTESLFLPNQDLLIPLNNSYFSDHVNLYLTYQYYLNNLDNKLLLNSKGINTESFDILTTEINDLTKTFSDLNLPLFSLDTNTHTEKQIADAIIYCITSGLYQQNASNIPSTFDPNLPSTYYRSNQNPSVIGKINRSYAFNNTNRNLVKLYPSKIIYDKLNIQKTFSGALEYRYSFVTAVSDRLLSIYPLN